MFFYGLWQVPRGLNHKSLEPHRFSLKALSNSCEPHPPERLLQKPDILSPVNHLLWPNSLWRRCGACHHLVCAIGVSVGCFFLQEWMSQKDEFVTARGISLPAVQRKRQAATVAQLCGARRKCSVNLLLSARSSDLWSHGCNNFSEAFKLCMSGHTTRSSPNHKRWAEFRLSFQKVL